MTFTSFKALASFAQPRAILTRVSPGAYTFYAQSNRTEASHEEQLEDVRTHCFRYKLTIKRETTRSGRLCLVVSSR